MKLVPTTGKASLGYKHLKGQTNLSDFGFISACPLPPQQEKFKEFEVDLFLPPGNPILQILLSCLKEPEVDETQEDE